ncbi:Aste57867_18511 [Aphanomyces stellatus]|uniref:Aste57867_18511 protein n=1 Tax=Aphanomyces stellatus TaxID=120398 RepID=A0A485LE22_9STRA|nr:hypothetical protein As57867_018449 [Aphanomyces stellatus]VFT95247.1 Aste57867_18511 [Aphanomyces stellatus]
MCFNSRPLVVKLSTVKPTARIQVSMSALHEALQTKNVEAMALALQKATKRDLQHRNEEGLCVLCAVLRAIEKATTKDKDCVDMYMLLVERSCVDVNCDCNGKSLLRMAVETLEIKAVKALLEHPSSRLDAKDGQTVLHVAAALGRDDVVDELLSHYCDIVDVNCVDKNGRTAFMVAILSAKQTRDDHVSNTPRVEPGANTTLLKYRHFQSVFRFVMCDKVDINFTTKKGGKTPFSLIMGIPGIGFDTPVQMAGRSDFDATTSDSDGETPLNKIISCGTAHVLRALLAKHSVSKLDIMGSKADHAAVDMAFKSGEIDVIELVLQYNLIESNLDSFAIDACEREYFEMVDLCLVYDRMDNVSPIAAEIAKCAPFLSLKSCVKVALFDLPILINDDGQVVEEPFTCCTWSTLMDASMRLKKLNESGTSRRDIVQAVLGDPKFATCRTTVAQKLAEVTDREGRNVLQITDPDTRAFLDTFRFFCGRYEIATGPPIHVSATAIVVNAWDHRLYKQLFDLFGSNETMAKDDFVLAVGRLGMAPDYANETREHFPITQSSFLRFCTSTFGEKAKVAMKFMRHDDEYRREVQSRKSLAREFVLGLLPMVSQTEFATAAATLTLSDGLSAADFPFVLVMSAADRSLEDIFLKEKPDDNKIRTMLQDVAMALEHLHSKQVVHGDLKKLNILRVNNRLLLTDMDASTSKGQFIGAKFSSGVLPPEMFYKLQNDAEVMAYEAYWDLNSPAWRKMKPRGDSYVVRSFRNNHSNHEIELPYALRKATLAIDMWAFGCLVYQLYSESELVPTDRNQDIEDEAIERAATWTDAALQMRVRNKVSNALAKDLILSLLVVNPDERMGAKQVLMHPYFDVASGTTNMAGLERKLDELQVQVQSGFDHVSTQLNHLIEYSREGLNQLASAKEDLMRGIFEATQVHVPTSFVILPFDLRDTSLGIQDAVDETTGFLHRIANMGDKFMAAAKANKAVGPAVRLVVPGNPLFLYLIDEVNGVPVVPESRDAVYPIRIDTKSKEYVAFMSATMPYIQTGFKYLKGVNTIAGFLKCLGVPSLDSDAMESLADGIDQATKTSSVFDFDVLQAQVEQVDKSAPVERIRGAALRQLVRFFEAFDGDNDFAGLERICASNGQALWTTGACAQAIEAKKHTSLGSKKVQTSDGECTVQDIYLDMISEKPSKDEQGLTQRLEKTEAQSGDLMQGCSCHVM